MHDTSFATIVSEIARNPDAPSELLNEAVAKYDPADPGPLLSLLRSDDPGIVGDGLYIFSEISQRGLSVIDDALKHIKGAAPDWRLLIASAIVEYCDRLSIEQVSQCLPLVEDHEEAVRVYAALILAKIDPDIVLTAAVGAGETVNQAAHALAHRLLREAGLDEALQAVEAERGVVQCYAGARIIMSQLSDDQLNRLKSAGADNSFAKTLLDTKRVRARYRLD